MFPGSTVFNAIFTVVKGPEVVIYDKFDNLLSCGVGISN